MLKSRSAEVVSRGRVLLSQHNQVKVIRSKNGVDDLFVVLREVLSHTCPLYKRVCIWESWRAVS